jgi:hypothetical protein
LTPAEYNVLAAAHNARQRGEAAQQKVTDYRVGLLLLAQGIKAEDVDEWLPGWRRKPRQASEPEIADLMAQARAMEAARQAAAQGETDGG